MSGIERPPSPPANGMVEKAFIVMPAYNAAAILLHSEGQYSPEMIPAMLGGGALKSGMPLYKYIANKSLTALENLAFGLSNAEYHSGLLIYSRRALESIPFQKLSSSFDFDLEMVVMAKIKGLQIRETAIPTIYAGEVSHLKPVPDGMKVLSVVRAYQRGYYHSL